MPELPEVETVRRGLAEKLEGQKIGRISVINASLRQAIPANLPKHFSGRTMTSISRRAKYLIMDTDGAEVLLCHLGMSGSFKIIPPKTHYTPQVHDHVIVEFSNGLRAIYNDPRRFGLILPVERTKLAAHALLAHLGPEPLEAGFSTEYLATALAARKGPVKTALMDQKLVVGVGNIYACEALFEARIHPELPAYKAVWHASALTGTIRSVLERALASGGSSLRDFYSVDGKAGYFQHAFAVYGRENKPCRKCGSKISRIIQAGRSSFFCPRCQKLSQVTEHKNK